MNKIKSCVFIKTRINPDLVEILIQNSFLKLSPGIQDILMVGVKVSQMGKYIDE